MKISLEMLATLRGVFGELSRKALTLQGKFEKAGGQVTRVLTLIPGSTIFCGVLRGRGEGAGPFIKASELIVLEGTYENKSEGFGGPGYRAGQ